jgi:hypothetical protein
MSEPILPIPTSNLPEPAAGSSTGEGAQTALAAMIRKRRMGENHVDDDPVQASPKRVPGA